MAGVVGGEAVPDDWTGVGRGLSAIVIGATEADCHVAADNAPKALNQVCPW